MVEAGVRSPLNWIVAVNVDSQDRLHQRPGPASTTETGLQARVSIKPVGFSQ